MQSAAAENRAVHDIIDFHNDVVDAHADKRGEEMFGGRNEDALAHKAGVA